MTDSESSPDTGGAATPIWISRHTRQVLIAAVLAALVLLLVHAPTLVRISIGGWAMALVLSFLVRRLARVMPRGLAIAISMLLAAGLIAVAITVVAPIVFDQLRAFVVAAPGIAHRLEERAPSLMGWLAAHGLMPESPQRLFEQLQQRLLGTVQAFAGRLLGRLGFLVSRAAVVAVSVLGMVFVAAYLLADARRIQAGALCATPHRYRRDVADLWNAFSHTLSRYLGGLVLATTTEGTLAAIALHFLGVPYAFLFGAWVALTAYIPYIGAWMGYAPAILHAFSISNSRGLITLLVCVLINGLVGNVIAPRIHGRTVRVPPLLVFLAVVAGGELFGFLGVVFAVPTVAMMRVLFEFFRARLRVVDSNQGVRVVEV